MEKTLLDWVLEKFPDTPRTRAKQWIAAGRVSLAGVVLRKPNQMLTDPVGALELQGRRLSTVVLEHEWRIHPRLALVHIDASLAIVNKGAGLLAVPAPYSELSALSILGDFLAGRLHVPVRQIAEYRLPPSFRHFEPLPVHRLDQFTTGVFCLALNPSARAHLIEQFSKHTATRRYVAFVDGQPKTPRGTWRHWLRFDEENLRQHIVARSDAEGVLEAITHFELVETYTFKGRAISKLRLSLETGRTHQIRVHAAHEHLPLIGDRVYHPIYHDARQQPGAVPIAFDRQALHAEELELEHPVSGKRLKWSVPLPDDLQKLERTLQGSKRTR